MTSQVLDTESAPGPILVVADTDQGRIRPLTLELVGAALRIRDLCGAATAKPPIRILVASRSPMGPAREIAGITGLDALGVRWPDPVTPETLKQGLARLLPRIRPGYLLFAHTTQGREVAPALAIRLQDRFRTTAVSGVTDICPGREGLVCRRPVMDNARVLSVGVNPGGLNILTLVPGAFSRDRAGLPDPVRPGKTEAFILPAAWLNPRLERMGLFCRPGKSREIGAAAIVVGAGRGIGAPENLEWIEAFAAGLPGACVGASRPLVDQGWIDYSRQVGITGAMVSPDLYIACGISGSTQHLAGMAGSRWVVSINTRKDAPICRHSDLCIQADLVEFIQAFLDSK